MLSSSKIRSFFTPTTIVLLLGIVGILSGAEALKSAEMSTPPLDWLSLAVIFVFSAIGIIFLLGIQLVFKNQYAIRFGWKFFFYVSAYFFGAGFSALAISIWQSSFSPASLLFLAIGAGTAVGSAIARSFSVG